MSYEELQPGKRLMGTVIGHRTLSDAEYVYTSPIVHVDVNQGRVETRNTVYQLGRPSDGYKSWEHQHRIGAVA